MYIKFKFNPLEEFHLNVLLENTKFYNPSQGRELKINSVERYIYTE
jgi:hypothetical protein